MKRGNKKNWQQSGLDHINSTLKCNQHTLNLKPVDYISFEDLFCIMWPKRSYIAGDLKGSISIWACTNHGCNQTVFRSLNVQRSCFWSGASSVFACVFNVFLCPFGYKCSEHVQSVFKKKKYIVNYSTWPVLASFNGTLDVWVAPCWAKNHAEGNYICNMFILGSNENKTHCEL